MLDVAGGIALVCSASVALLALIVRRSAAWSARARTVGALLAVAGIVLFALVLRDSLLLTRVLPFSNAIVAGNWTPLPVAILVGLAWRGVPGAVARKSALLALLVLGCLWFSYGSLLEKPPACHNEWSSEVCMQTSPATCSAAAAATLLTHHGILATESEMARLCFTSRRGTTHLGLYRGLKLKTAGTPWDVQVFRGTLEELRVSLDQPMILFVGLARRDSGRVDPRYEREWGWSPGATHTVVIYRFMGDGRIDMADPSNGREFWHEESIQVLWHGEGLQLVKR